MRTRTLTVEGITYYCEFRKCGKAGCRCAGDGDHLHGPYWYMRDPDGAVSYIGKALSDDVEIAYRRVLQSHGDIEQARRELLNQAEALRRLAACDSLTAKQHEMVRTLGFGACLVSPGGLATTQETETETALPIWRL